MGQQVFDYLSMQGYDCVIMEMDDAFPAKSVEYRREWDQRVFHGKDLIIIYSEAMADAMLNPMTDVHHLLRIILPEIGTVNIFKFNLQVYVEHYCKLNLNFGKVERIRKQLEGDGYYSDILGSTTVYPLRIIGYKKESGRYAVQAVKNYLKSDKR